MAKNVLPKWAATVTPFSKYLAMALFILFPFVGFYFGLLVGANHPSTPLPSDKLISSPSETPSPTLVYSEIPNKLVVTRPEDKTDHLSALTITITDETKVRKLYEDIYLLPTFVPGSVYNCPEGNYSKYLLDFYLNNTLISHGVYTPTGCASVKLDNLNARADWHRSFASDLQHSLGLYGKDFYGHQP
jgi:hypothetical protein